MKFPLITGVLAIMSVIMYYQSAEATGMVAGVMISVGVYMILSFGAEAVGGLLKRMIGGM